MLGGWSVDARPRRRLFIGALLSVFVDDAYNNDSDDLGSFPRDVIDSCSGTRHETQSGDRDHRAR